MSKKKSVKPVAVKPVEENAAPKLKKCEAKDLGHRSCKCGRVGCGGVTE
jgi:hypothetical protein